MNFLWAGVGAVAALVALVLGSRHGVYPPVFTLGIGPRLMKRLLAYARPYSRLIAVCVTPSVCQNKTTYPGYSDHKYE